MLQDVRNMGTESKFPPSLIGHQPNSVECSDPLNSTFNLFIILFHYVSVSLISGLLILNINTLKIKTTVRSTICNKTF